MLVGMVHARNGDVGVAQTLALAGDGRSVPTLRDPNAWSSQVEAVALFNAAALVTGDGAIGLHVGENSCSPRPTAPTSPNGCGPSAPPRWPSSTSRRWPGTSRPRSRAAPLQTAADHALIRVTPRSMDSRHAHLCEMTRGLLSRIPELYGLGPTFISETECSARGGRSCLYAVSWEDPASSEMVGTGTGRPSQNQSPQVVDGEDPRAGTSPTAPMRIWHPRSRRDRGPNRLKTWRRIASSTNCGRSWAE